MHFLIKIVFGKHAERFQRLGFVAANETARRRENRTETQFAYHISAAIIIGEICAYNKV